MLRVMHIVQAPGGVERYIHTLLKKIDKENIENILVCSQDYDIDKFKELTIKIVCVEMHREIGFLSEIMAIVQIRRTIKKYKPDIVYMHSSKAGAISRIANLGIKNISIYNAHGWAFNMQCSKAKKCFYAVIEKILAPFCTSIVAISNFEKESALRWHICKSNKIRVIYNGIDFDEYMKELGSRAVNEQERNKIVQIPQNVYVVGFVGRITKQKSPEIFIHAARIIRNKIPNAFFLMVGDGEQRDKTELLINALNLADCVLITGWTSNPLAYIEKMNVAMFLSRWEGFGLVLAEYMYLDKPIVATRVDAIPNIIEDGVNGLLVELDDYKAAAKAVIEIYDNDNLRETLMNNGKDVVTKRFDATRTAKEHEMLFAELAGKY